MPRADMAALAEHRRPRDEQAIVVRAVRIVAGAAALATCGVVPEERPALLGMARKAALVDVIADTKLLDVCRSVRIVARRARHLAFTDGHVRRAHLLVHLGPVTRRAHLDDARLDELRLFRLRAVD